MHKALKQLTAEQASKLELLNKRIKIWELKQDRADSALRKLYQQKREMFA